VNGNVNVNGSVCSVSGDCDSNVSCVECSSVVGSGEKELCDSAHCSVSSSSSSSSCSASAVAVTSVGKLNSTNGTNMLANGWRSDSGSGAGSGSGSGSVSNASSTSSVSGCKCGSYGNGSSSRSTAKSSNGMSMNGMCRTGSSPRMESGQLYWNRGVVSSRSTGTSLDSVSSSMEGVVESGNSEELKNQLLCLVDRISQMEYDRALREVDSNRLSYIEQENAYLQSIVTDTYRQIYQLQHDQTVLKQHIERDRKTIEEMSKESIINNKYANELRAAFDVYYLSNLHQLNMAALQQLEQHYRQGLEQIQAAKDRLSGETGEGSSSSKEEGNVGGSGTGSLSRRCASISMCWMCSRSQVCVVCMPCRHQVCCAACASCLPRCSQCQSPVSHTVPLLTGLPSIPRPPPSPAHSPYSHVSPLFASISSYPGSSSAYSSSPSATPHVPMPSALASLLALDPATTTMRLYTHTSACSPPVSPSLISSTSTSTSTSSGSSSLSPSPSCSPRRSHRHSRNCSGIQEQAVSGHCRVSHRLNAYCIPPLTCLSVSVSSDSTSVQLECGSSNTIGSVKDSVSSVTSNPISTTAKRSSVDGASTKEHQFTDGIQADHHTDTDSGTSTSTSVSSNQSGTDSTVQHSVNKPISVHVQSNIATSATTSTHTNGNGNSNSPTKYNSNNNNNNTSNSSKSMSMCGVVEYGVVDSRQGDNSSGTGNGSGSSTCGSVSSTPSATIRLLPLS
jgi:hypothetical protein